MHGRCRHLVEIALYITLKEPEKDNIRCFSSTPLTLAYWFTYYAMLQAVKSPWLLLHPNPNASDDAEIIVLLGSRKKTLR